ncbi:MAG: isoleucine--tRNA ligase [Anaerohalosphaeraceae bacterium]|nr:isoleucine--tRNA ligase [Anaerohalosphaeraceae bacterium]
MSENKTNYRDTLNLPKTTFGMKANLTQRQPQQIKAWQKMDIYGKIRDARKDSPLYVLHDGPPYANGDIHMGHVINKVLKDIVVKYKTMTGFYAPYVPGWDCHGLPIEVKVMAEVGEKIREMEKPQIRQLCKKYASKYVKLQAKQFQNLGIFGDFNNPYLTLKPQYEAGMCEVFAELVGKGLVYKQLKPIHWSIGCQTALADAELEYQDIDSPSVFVNFGVTAESAQKLKQLGLISQDSQAKICFMIWTTTPWTLAANLAVSVNPNLEYKVLSYEASGQQFCSVIASERADAVIAAAGLENYSLSENFVKGSDLIGLRYDHPFIEKNPTEKEAYIVIGAKFVTTEDGTGLVHTAPGHGVDDYVAGQQHNMAVYSPVTDDGCYDETAPDWLVGKSVLKVDDEIIENLQNRNSLFARSKISHSYPHCWRSRMPVIFRATEQWFISVDNPVPDGESLRQMALDSMDEVKWVPAWGRKRISGMLESRPDWCISRQRSWGMPIPVFYDSEGTTLLTKESVLAVGEHFRKKGSDSWFTDSPQEILGADFKLPAGFRFDDLEKEENIFDVWFESGCSWHSVAEAAGWPVPVDLYLEGSDQHRGWFQLSLLPALGVIGRAPFKTVLTHGFTVDEHGKKQSKSQGNYVNAQEEIDKYGSDILRLWVASVNYQEDMRCSDTLIGRLQDAYRKIRNTLRYLLGNINDFVPAEQKVAYEDMLEIDKWAMQQFQKLAENVHNAYENFMFHRAYTYIYNFCTIEMSSVYMDVLKDRLYCDSRDSLSRRSAQTAMHRILDGLIKMLTPILAHTAEEAYAAMEYKYEDVESVHLAEMPKPDENIGWRSEQARWDKLTEIRNEIMQKLESLRQENKIASNQEACVTITTDDKQTLELLNGFESGQFAAFCIVSEVEIINASADELITVSKCSNDKCQRCWNYWPSVGTDKDSPDLCDRCREVIADI